MFKPSHRIAQDLLIDDKFRMGGSMYQIDDVRESFGGLMTIRFYPLADTNSVVKMVLTVERGVIFKIYNQNHKKE